MKKLLIIFTLFVGCALCMSAHSHESLNVIVTMPVGSAVDVTARQWVKRYDEVFGTSSIITNKPGAEGQIGIKYFLTLKETNDFIPVVWPAMSNFIAYSDPDKENIVPVIELSRIPWMLIAKKDFPANNFKEYVEYLRSNPGKVNQGVNGAVWLIMLKEIATRTNTQPNAILYQKNRPEVDVASGVLDTAWTPISSTLGTGLESRLKILALTSNIPLEGYPNLALGTDARIGTWYTYQGIYVNSSLPKNTRETLYNRFVFVRNLARIKELGVKNHAQYMGNNEQEDFKAHINDLSRRLTPK